LEFIIADEIIKRRVTSAIGPNARYRGRHDAYIAIQGPIVAKTALPLFDHFIGEREDIRRQFEADRFCSVDHK
jgi:hypothetical protein